MSAPHSFSCTPSPRRRGLLRMVRPSLTDLRFTGDPWIVQQSEEVSGLCLGDYRLANIRSLPIDLPSLNQTLDRLRHRRPHRRS